MEAITTAGERVVLFADRTWAPQTKETFPSGGDGFRRSRWGATREDVRSTESSEPFAEDEGMLVYEVTVAELSAHAYYIFINDVLVRAKYAFQDEYQNRLNYLRDYDQLKEFLQRKYGKPTEDNIFWSNDLYEDDPQEWGMAVSCGHHSRFCRWLNESTDIWLAVTGENFEVTVALEYNSVAHAGITEQVREAQILDDL
jgi:hypothetical protein